MSYSSETGGRMKKPTFFGLLLLGTWLFVAGRCWGADAEIVPLEAGASTVKPWLAAVIDVVYAVLGAVLAWVFAKIGMKVKDDAAKAAAIEALHVGVTQTYQTLYKQWKFDSMDQKLTAEEKRLLRENAIKVSMDVAKGAGLQCLQAWGTDALHSLVERIVQKMKLVERIVQKMKSNGENAGQ